jgi:hypothetical protein
MNKEQKINFGGYLLTLDLFLHLLINTSRLSTQNYNFVCGSFRIFQNKVLRKICGVQMQGFKEELDKTK